MKCSAWIFFALLSAAAFAKDKSQVPCRAYFVAIEQDSITVNLQMAGLNKLQSAWYRKGGNSGEYEGVCLVNLDPSGRQIPLKSNVDPAVDESVSKTIGGLPLYLISWEEHEDRNHAGYLYYSANGTISLATQQGTLEPIAPIHDTNRTRFSSSSVSLLKAALKEIRSRLPGA